MDFSAKMFSDIPDVIRYHYKEGNINYFMTGFHVVIHALAIVGLFNITNAKAATLFFAWQMTWFR